MRLGILNMPHQIVGQIGIKIKTSIAGGKDSNPLQRICLNQDGRACKQNKLAKSVNFVKFKVNMLQKNKVNVFKNHKTVLKAKLVKDLDLLT